MVFLNKFVLVLAFALFFLFFPLVGAWSIDDFCVDESNGSLPDYVDCVDYFGGLNESVVINNTVVINNVTNNTIVESSVFNYTTVVFVNNSVDDRLFPSFSDVYTRKEVDLLLDNLRLHNFNDFKDELASAGWLSVVKTVNYTVDDDFVTVDELQGEFDRFYRTRSDGVSSASNPIGSTTIFVVLLVVVVVGVFFWYSNNKSKKYDLPDSRGASGFQGYDREKEDFRQLVEKQQNTINALRKGLDESKEMNEKFARALKDKLKDGGDVSGANSG